MISKAAFAELKKAIETATVGLEVEDAITVLCYFRVSLIARLGDTMPEAVAILDMRNEFDRLTLAKDWDALHSSVFAYRRSERQ